MVNLLSRSIPIFKVVACLTFMLLPALLLWPGRASIYAATAASRLEQVADLATTHTLQNFDLLNTGTPYLEGIHEPQPTKGPQRLPGGPTGVGSFMRLAFTDTFPTHNSLAFSRVKTGPSNLIVADFDFRMTLDNNGRADGLGFSLLNTAHYGLTKTVAPVNIAEEPNFLNSGEDISASYSKAVGGGGN